MKVALVGPLARPNAASTAAGAMLNVYGEIDGPLDDYGRRKLEIGLRAIKMWREFAPAELFVADRTEIRLKANAPEFERNCFFAIEEALGYPNPFKLSGQRYQYGGVLDVRGEPALNTPALFEWLHSRLRNEVRLLPGYGDSQTDSITDAPKHVYCAGAWTRQAMGSLGQQILPLFFGVGNAMVLTGAKIDIPPRTVVRTPNRGNTCGVHIVPRGPDQFYIGAGSFISKAPVPGARLETIAYLTRCIQEDLGADIWRASVEPVVGYRPVSLDGKPMLGPLQSDGDVYVATGTKRDGLTYAPVIAEDICNWATGKPRSGVFDGWEPDRKPISYGDEQTSLGVYRANKIAAEMEHGRNVNDADLLTTYLRARKNARTAHHLPANFGLHPEMVGVFA